jgi:hypothetical protein
VKSRVGVGVLEREVMEDSASWAKGRMERSMLEAALAACMRAVIEGGSIVGGVVCFWCLVSDAACCVVVRACIVVTNAHEKLVCPLFPYLSNPDKCSLWPDVTAGIEQSTDRKNCRTGIPRKSSGG